MTPIVRSLALPFSRSPVLPFALIAACATKEPPKPIAPIESTLQVCTIDPIAPAGFMTLSAIHVHATNDTVVVQSDGRVPLAQAVAGPQVLSDAKWITARTPLVLQTSVARVTFLPTGQPRVFVPGKITLFALMRGLPLYGVPSEVGPMHAELEALAARGVELEQALQQKAGLRRQMTRVKTLYIPTSIVGCSFQAFTPRRR